MAQENQHTQPPTPTRCWVSSISLDHVLLGVEGGFTQAGHGGDTRLRRLRRGDTIAFYSPRSEIGAAKPLQCFTALGEVTDDEPYRVRVGEADPWRRRMSYEKVGRVPVRPLLPMLGFVTDEERWGLPFRRGLFEVTRGDAAVIAGALRDAGSVAAEFYPSGRAAGA